MTPKNASYWPDVAQGAVRTPAVILKEQAAILGQQTRNLVEGRVTSTPSGDRIVVDFDLVVPALKYYSYRLLRVVHGVLPYPATVAAHRLPPSVAMALSGKVSGTAEAQDEETFTNILKDILSSEETKRVLEALLAQAKA